MAKAPIYLDYAATSPMLPEVKTAMCEVMDMQVAHQLGNASSLHNVGHRAQVLIEDAREKIARLINADPTEIIFTSGGSEANNTVMEIFRGQKIAVSSVEHPSVLESAKARAGELQILDVDEWGKIVGEPKEVKLTSVMLANNELGTLQDIAELRRRYKHGFFHTDATQALGKIHIDIKELGVDFATFSAHKIGGPIGVGVLYVKNGAPYKPLILGGGQESHRRAGTSNVASIVGFSAAADWCWQNWSCKQYARIRELRDWLAREILRQVPYSSLNTPLEESLPHILNVSFRAAEGESIQLYLDAEGIVVSTGSACASGSLDPSHVIMATRHDAEVAHSSVRFSLGLDTTKAELERVIRVLKNVVVRLQGISTIKIGE